MSFKTLNFSPSSNIEALSKGLEGSLKEIQGCLSEGVGNLDSLSLASSDSSSLSELLGGIRDEATATLKGKVNFMAISPYQHTVGVRKGDNSYLTPANALNIFKNRFSELLDEIDENKQEKGLILLNFMADSEKSLANSLEAFNSFFPLVDLQKLERRAKALASLEVDKFKIPQSPGYPSWGESSPANEEFGQKTNKALGALISASEGMAQKGKSPLDILSSFAEKQSEKIKSKLDDLKSLSDSMQGSNSSWQALYFQGDLVAINDFLKKISPAPDEKTSTSYKNSALLCWYGQPESLNFYKESFGL